MAKRKTRQRAQRASETKESKLYTLTEVGKKSGVSMPTMQRYKKEYQSRIPSEGRGRKQRYPEEAIAVVREIKEENLKRRGGARRGKATTKAKTKAKAKTGTRAATARTADDAYLPLTEIARRAGISYPTARKYAAQHPRSIPSRGRGRSRRYGVETVEVFKSLRAESRRGRRPGAARGGRKKAAARGATTMRSVSVQDRAMAQRIQQLERAQQDISRQLQEIINTLRQPIQVTIEGR